MEAEKLRRKIASVVGDDKVVMDEIERKVYSHEAGYFSRLMDTALKWEPDCIVKPKTAEDISEIVKVAEQVDETIIPLDGECWGHGGALPVNGGIVVDIMGMDGILNLDEKNLNVTCEAGIRWNALYDMLSNKGLLIGAYPINAPSATVGGWINTGGYGIGSYKYGGVSDQIRSIEVVLPNGKIINTGFKDVLSNSSGYNLNSMFVGAEGTLGVITKATLKIYPLKEIRLLSYSFSGMKALSEAIFNLTRSKVTPLNISFVDKNHFEFLKAVGKDVSCDGALINIALEGSKERLDIEESLIGPIMKDGKKESDVIAEREWAARYYGVRTKELEFSTMLGEAFVSVSHMNEMAEEIYELTYKMNLRAAITGTVVDRNTVVFTSYYLTDERKLIRDMISLVFIKKLSDIGSKYGSGPANLGVFHTFSTKKALGTDTTAIKDIKAALDPHNIMNSGKLPEEI